ncbi:MAG: flagellar export chaperone FliS [Lachnospiraceae bacterium]|nr:flagellar export chaperone FliS [Lachnospiraceae bacterium]
MTNEKKQAFTLRITSANSTELIEILYEMLLEYVEDAKVAIEKNDIMEIHDSIRKARGCLKELMESIDFAYDIAGYFMSLYAYVNKELLLAEIRKDVTVFDNVKVVIEPLRDAYTQLSQLDKSEPVMQNTQKITAGLTYSRGNINESIEEQNNRGFYV